VKSGRAVRGLLFHEIFSLLVLSHDGTDLQRDSCRIKGVMRKTYLVHYPTLINYRYFKQDIKKVLGPESDEVSENLEILHIEKLRKLYMSRILCSECLRSVCKHSIVRFLTVMGSIPHLIHTISLFIPTITNSGKADFVE
jgi:hypothetical protein